MSYFGPVHDLEYNARRGERTLFEGRRCKACGVWVRIVRLSDSKLQTLYRSKASEVWQEERIPCSIETSK